MKLLINNRSAHATRVTLGETGTRLYKIWCTMKQRTKNPHTVNYSLYGGKGINVCEAWSEYEQFRSWSLENGYNDSLTLDRIDGDKGYTPENCRWVSMKVQQNNRCNNHLLTFNGETLTLSLWAERIGMKPKTLSRRIVDKKWSIERALTTPLDVSKRNKRCNKI